MAYCVYYPVDAGATTRFFPVAKVPTGSDVPAMYLTLVATGTPSPPAPTLTLALASSSPVAIPFQVRTTLQSGNLVVDVTYDPLGPTPTPGAGESQFLLKFFLISGSIEMLHATVCSMNIDASAGQSFAWVVSDTANDSHGVVLPYLAARSARITGPLKVGTATSAANITRFTSEAIQGLSNDDLGATAPTGQAVKNFVNFAIPPGTVMAFASETIPAGWRECDGSSLDGANASFAAIFAVIGKAFGTGNGSTTGFNLPDLRGRFVRGWNHGAGRDPDAATRTASGTSGQVADHVGSAQGHQFGSHNHTVSLSGVTDSASPFHSHTYSDNVVSSWSYWTTAKLTFGGSNQVISTIGTASWSSTTGGASPAHQHSLSMSGTTSSPGGAETRPANMYLVYIIKL